MAHGSSPGSSGGRAVVRVLTADSQHLGAACCLVWGPVLARRGRRTGGELGELRCLDFGFRQLKLRRNPNCVVCGEQPTVTELIDYEQFCGMPAFDGSGGGQAAAGIGAADGGDGEGGIREIDVFELQRRIERGDRFQLIDVHEPWRRTSTRSKLPS